MKSEKPMAIVLGLALVLSATAIITTNTVTEASTTLDLRSSLVSSSTNTVTVLDQLPGSAVANKVVLHSGEKVTLNGKLMTINGDRLSNMPVNIYALTPTPEQKLIGNTVTGIDGSFSVTWPVEPYYIKPASTETLRSQGSQTMNIFATFEGNDSYDPSKSQNLSVNVKSWDLMVQMESDKTLYNQGDSATIFVNFIQGDRLSGQIDYGDFVAPDVIKADFDGNVIELQKKKEGTYTFIVDSLSKEHHQLVVNSEKQGHNPGTAYLTLIVEGLR